MTENNFKNEKEEQSLASPAPNKSKSPWHSPRLDVLKGSYTQHGSGTANDGGSIEGLTNS